MTNNITSPEGEANVLSHIRHDWKMLHSHPWVDAGRGERKRALRLYIRCAITRIRLWRREQARRARLGKAVAA